MFGFNAGTVSINNIIDHGASKRLTDNEFILNEIRRFSVSQRRKDMLDGEKYYRGRHDILHRKRTMIGENGRVEAVDNLPNNRIVDNQYKKMVNQKCNYLVGQPLTFQSDNNDYVKSVKPFFNKAFLRTLKNVAHDSLNCGIGWLFCCYDESGEFAFKRLRPHEIIPGWRDAEHTVLDYVIRVYEIVEYEGKHEKVVRKVEVYEENGIYRFTIRDGLLVPDENHHEPYFTVANESGVQGFNWTKIPMIPFKYNSDETPLINSVKSLQDGLNLIISNFQNNMEEDARNTILVLSNYDGQKLDEFRKNLATYGVVKVRTIDGAAGDLKSLQIEVNAENYQAIIEIFKKAIIENAMGYDAKDDRLGGNALTLTAWKPNIKRLLKICCGSSTFTLPIAAKGRSMKLIWKLSLTGI
jgi:SPP1 family phage portal protein